MIKKNSSKGMPLLYYTLQANVLKIVYNFASNNVYFLQLVRTLVSLASIIIKHYSMALSFSNHTLHVQLSFG